MTKETIESSAKLFQDGYSVLSIMSSKEKLDNYVMEGIETFYNSLGQNPDWQDKKSEGLLLVVNAIEDEKIKNIYLSASRKFLSAKIGKSSKNPSSNPKMLIGIFFFIVLTIFLINSK